MLSAVVSPCLGRGWISRPISSLPERVTDILIGREYCKSGKTGTRHSRQAVHDSLGGAAVKQSSPVAVGETIRDRIRQTALPRSEVRPPLQYLLQSTSFRAHGGPLLPSSVLFSLSSILHPPSSTVILIVILILRAKVTWWCSLTTPSSRSRGSPSTRMQWWCWTTQLSTGLR